MDQNAKPEMSLETAKEFLSASVRDAIVDDNFGDSEVYWLRDGREVAYGYFSSSSDSVSIEETKKFAPTTFRGDDAQQHLKSLGQSGHIEINNEMSVY